MIKALPGFVLIEPLDGEEKTDSGIILTESVRKRTPKGIIKSVGDPSVNAFGTTISASVKEGQTVLFRRVMVQEFTHQNKEWLLVPFEDLVAIIEP